MNDRKNRPSECDASLHVGVLGSPTGWYLRDLMRAAHHMPPPLATTVQPLSFAKFSVWSQGKNPATVQSVIPGQVDVETS
jgi:hypothetical protein